MKARVIGVGVVVVAAVLLAAGCGGSRSSSSSSSKPAATASIHLVPSDSLCIATGIDDPYTGNGHVTFYLTFENTGDADGTISVTPIRYYSDGSDNRSPLDDETYAVSAGSTQKFHSAAMKYKAHEHGVTGCAVDAGDGEEKIALIGP